MPSDLSSYRRLYASLVRLYPKGYRERYGEGMEQTFSDLCREQADGPSSAFLLSTFADTLFSLFFQHLSSLTSSPMTKHFLRPILITLVILLIPFVGNYVSAEFDWTTSDFVFMGILLFGASFTFEMVARLSGNAMFKWAVGIVTVATLLLTWMNLAVGIIGSEDNPINALYFLVIPVGFLGLIASQMKAKGLAVTAYLMSATVMAVPFIGLAVNRPAMDDLPGIIGVFMITAFYAALYLGSGLLFRTVAGAKS